ncbi:hypothetical protein Ddye_011700 [Dipteronia dyeriana]|uniref:Cation-transporting P-type ATPase N-terminal domain-containing protein n=1 Tax=Dipteronia dyeriana TaxID=168575 RepID=A0AAD9X2Z1_9ROSI|nr:hypothetical protein Ddye_011700 [Dipteronia dyeriana]
MQVTIPVVLTHDDWFDKIDILMGKGNQNYGKIVSFDRSSSKNDTFPDWAKDVKECEEEYHINHETGLSNVEVEKRRAIHGFLRLTGYKLAKE